MNPLHSLALAPYAGETIIINARLVRNLPTPSTDQHLSTVHIQHGKISSVSKQAQPVDGSDFRNNRNNAGAAELAESAVVDANGQLLSFALADLSIRVSEKGGNQQDVLSDVMRLAVQGGVAHVACMPDANPILDEPRLVKLLLNQAKSLNLGHLHPVGALTHQLKGEQLAEMATLQAQGCVAMSQADYAIENISILNRALAYAASHQISVWMYCQHAQLGQGFAASGPFATRLGLAGIPVASESIALLTLFELLKGLGKQAAPKVHISRIASARAVALIRQAKSEGLAITCDVNVHHLHFIDQDIGFFDSAFIFKPPLRSDADRYALRQGVMDGTIDAVVSDHTAVDPDHKLLPVGQAKAGAVGVQWLLHQLLLAAQQEKTDPAQFLSACTGRAYQVLGRDIPDWVAGANADLVLFDHQVYTSVSRRGLDGASLQHQNTPWIGYELPGEVKMCWVDGVKKYDLSAQHIETQHINVGNDRSL